VKDFQKDSFIEKFTKSLQHFINKKEIKVVLILKQLNKSTKSELNKKKLGFIQEKVSELRLFEKNHFFNEGLNLVFTAIKNAKHVKLLAKFIANELKQAQKNHNFFLQFIKTTLTLCINNTKLNSGVHGLKIKIKGKFNKAARARHKIILIGRLPLLAITSNIDYSEVVAYNFNGTFGVKVWIYKSAKCV
jgi:ribosomal protein S3